MSVPRVNARAVALADGRILVVGGYANSHYHASAELFDAQSGAFSTAGSMAAGRMSPVAVRLADGRVLVAGGSDAIGARADAELFDPAGGTFAFAGTMAAAREAATAALLADGRVLVAGGADFFDEGAWRSAEAYRAPIPDPIFADGFERTAE
jgi:hypothetical protein